MEEEAIIEISRIIQVLGDNQPIVEVLGFSGIIAANTSLSPFEVVEKIRQKILDEPWAVRYCHRFIPIQETIQTDLGEIVKAVQKHVDLVKPTDTYRITIEKRGSDLSSKEIINAVADSIHNKVSLEKYDWNIIIEVLGKIACISILKEKDIVSTLKTKRDLME